MTTVLSTTTPIRFDPVDAICTHRDAICSVLADSPGCSNCLTCGATGIDLRICMTCGHVGCCDDSPNRHARAHHATSLHPIMRSVEPGETWGWCYLDDELLFSSTHPDNPKEQTK
jgi:monovalent cation:H+ antiporter-2, CPA2 family